MLIINWGRVEHASNFTFEIGNIFCVLVERWHCLMCKLGALFPLHYVLLAFGYSVSDVIMCSYNYLPFFHFRFVYTSFDYPFFLSALFFLLHHHNILLYSLIIKSYSFFYCALLSYQYVLFSLCILTMLSLNVLFLWTFPVDFLHSWNFN